ncbi:YceD family protein [Legionella worsleiensis]|uniref:Large ribosomal RNA subunit accumulation protein YceD n=1 Tax=Legionella worsleiensis TaxID=45076 RepID=A0A0W1AJU3_9GAMM|nr:YceD family protein [Legionella worsleiensis]KTD81464.1 metal-binding protein [Legionella worsleiensis]STY30192.1 metal-binding, possibly nucleic acid-binding protein [Legionella worsleiensis]
MLHLPELAKQSQQIQTVTVHERLPSFIHGPCQLTVALSVEAKDDYFLLHLHTNGVLQVICQRCLSEFPSSYDNKTTVAVCRSDERAEQILELYECVVASNWQVDLLELVVDELHLYAPQFHTEIEDCSSEVNDILTGKIETS